MDAERLQDWIGKTESLEDRIGSFPANALAATLDRDDPPYRDATSLPPLWHWLYFLPVYKLSDAGYDGHAALGGFLPPVPLPRRMWAGGRLTFHAPMRIGRTLRKVSTIKSIAHKQGRTGPLAFVTVGHQVFDGHLLGVDEEHDIVYREKPDPTDAPPDPPRAPEHADFSRAVTAGPVMLFRYSALTFNGHRIHYDHPFSTGSEGYGGLVVHGPLLATLLLDLLRRERPEAVVRRFEFKALAPLMDTDPFDLCGADGADDGALDLWVRRADGSMAMSAKVELAETAPPVAPPA